MKLIRKAKAPSTSPVSLRHSWKILVIDDEADVRQLTELNLRDFSFSGRRLEFIHAASAREALAQFSAHPDIALALVDVVMETDDAGLRLVETVRNELHNRMVRLVIRTGQPGVAPERYVIDNFDIDDYKDKTELTAQRLYTTVRSALKAYQDLQTIELNRRGLEQVLEATPNLYRMRSSTLQSFFEGVLTQIVALCKLTHAGIISTFDGLLTTVDGESIQIQTGVGELYPPAARPERLKQIVDLCARAVRDQELLTGLRDEAMIVPLLLGDEPMGFIYLETSTELTEDDRTLVRIMANQCSAALENFRLHGNLQLSYERIIDMLARVAEFKDSTTGQHIQRMSEYSRRIALQLGFDEAAADACGRAARLHDVGKVGIPDAVLRKPGKLTEEEFDIIKTHPGIGARILGEDPALSDAKLVAYCHHEHFDGSGYPRGLVGEEIPLIARIVSVADFFDALVSERPYKPAWSLEDAVTKVEQGSGHFFDPQVVAAFMAVYRNGSLAEAAQLFK